MRSSTTAGTYLAVGIGGMVAGVVRMLIISTWSLPSSGAALPVLLVNTAGSALIAVVFAFSEPGGRFRLPPWLALGLMAGFCGALTTFSTFAVEVLALMPAWSSAAGYIMLSLLCWLAAAAAGLSAGRRLNATA